MKCQKKALEFAKQSEIQTNEFRSQNDKIKTAFLEIQGTMAEKIDHLEKQLKQSEIQINKLSSPKDKAKMDDEMTEKIEQLEKQVNEADEIENNSMKAINELIFEEQTKQCRYQPGHGYFPGKSEKVRNDLIDFIKKRFEKEGF